MSTQNTTKHLLNEDEIKCALSQYFKDKCWEIISVQYGNKKGIDFEAKKDKLRWKIEVKSEYERPQANRNSFLEVWGEILTRMDNPEMDNTETHYGVAFPDTKRYRELCEQITSEAKKRIRVFILFFKIEGNVLKEIDLLSWNGDQDIKVPPPFENFGVNKV